MNQQTNSTKKRQDRVITIDKELHAQVREHCNKTGMKIGFFATEAVRRHLGRLTQQESDSQADARI